MTNLIHCVTFLLLMMTFAVSGWKTFNLTVKNPKWNTNDAYYGPTTGLVDDEALPRNYVHSIYKFGWCSPDSIQKVFLHKVANITLSDWQSTQANYIYLLGSAETVNDRLACIVMTTYVPRKHLFRNSRLPIHYCQGDLYFVWKETYQRIALHEFYLHQRFNLPANFHFKFYHPTPL